MPVFEANDFLVQQLRQARKLHKLILVDGQEQTELLH